MPEGTGMHYIETGTGPRSLLTKKLLHIKDIFKEVLSSDPENAQHRESLGCDGARALQ